MRIPKHRTAACGESLSQAVPVTGKLGWFTAAALPAASAIMFMSSPVIAQIYGPQVPPPALHFDREGDGRLLPCAPRISCVSTANFMSPSQYLAPWSFDPWNSDQAKRLLLDELRARGGTVIQEDEAKGYIAALVPYQLGPGRRDVDLLEFKFTPDGRAAAFRSEAGVNIPPPPFCWTPGCISGPGNRARMEALRDSLGWSSQETDEEKTWVQILLHD